MNNPPLTTFNYGWDTLAPSEIDQLLRTLSELQHFNATESPIVAKQLADGGYMMHWLQLAQSQDAMDCKASCIGAYMECKVDLAAPPTSVSKSPAGFKELENLLEQPDDGLALCIVDRLRHGAGVATLWKTVSIRGKYDALLLACLRVLARQEVVGNFSADELLRHWKALRDFLNAQNPSGFQDLIAVLSRQTNFVQGLLEAEGEFKGQNAGLYAAVLDSTHSDVLNRWCIEGLRALDKPAWTRALGDNSDVIMLTTMLAHEGEELSLLAPYEDALVAWGLQIADGTKPKAGMPHQHLFDALDHSLRPAARSLLLSAAMERKGKCASKFFELFGPQMADAEAMRKHNDIIEGLFSRIIEHRVAPGVLWLLSVIEAHPRLLDAYDWADLRVRLQQEFKRPEGEQDEAHSLIIQLAQTLGIEAPIESAGTESHSDE